MFCFFPSFNWSLCKICRENIKFELLLTSSQPVSTVKFIFGDYFVFSLCTLHITSSFYMNWFNYSILGIYFIVIYLSVYFIFTYIYSHLTDHQIIILSIKYFLCDINRCCCFYYFIDYVFHIQNTWTFWMLIFKRFPRSICIFICNVGGSTWKYTFEKHFS